MRTIPSALQPRLDSGVTTLCRCWVITRADGMVRGFTEHDEDVVVGAVICRAGSGFSGSEVTQRLGLAVDGAELSGALADDTLNEDDLAAGRYDAAEVELWLVDWSAPELQVLLAKGTLGEVRREGSAFTAEVRGLAQQLAAPTGRLYTATCSADLGDARCGINLNDPLFHGNGTVDALLATARFRANGLGAFADGWFSAGKLTFGSGANAGLAVEVKRHYRDGVDVLELWQAMPQPVEAGDAFTVTAGCDKRFATCHVRFANAMNFRGFPHIPGNDFLVRYPVQGEPGHDGGSLQS
jgi:uncharacterized phage protein (TIGR02218 family)